MSNPFKDWQIIEPISGDASARQYFRVEKDGKTAILMDCSAETENKAREFMAIGEWLRSIGLHAPGIFESSAGDGFLLLEDFGDVSFKKAIESGGDRLLYYVLATDVLKHLRAHPCPLKLPAYTDSNIHKGHRRIIDWYVPMIKQAKNPDGMIKAYMAAWEKIEKSLSPCPQGFIHGDFHLENLMVRPDGEGLAHCGILDFQDAMQGPIPYDLVNLLEDARTDVPDETRIAMMAYYTSDLKPAEAAAFESWYRVLGTQFHCRVIGLFIRLALVAGKTQYLVHIPRLEAYIQNALKDPLLAPLKVFFSDIKLDFKTANGLNAALKKEYVRSDAF